MKAAGVPFPRVMEGMPGQSGGRLLHCETLVVRVGVRAPCDMHSGRGIVNALAAAVLFGASTPLAKTLVGEIPPVLLAGLFYIGSGIGLSIVILLRRLVG